MNEFSAGACIRFGWETFKKRPWFLIVVTLVALILLLLFKPGQFNAPWFDVTIIDIACLAITLLIDMGLAAFFLKAEENVEAAKFSDLWHPHPFWRYVGAVVISGVLSVIGLCLLIVPGIILILMWMFVKYIVIDRGLSPIKALEESARITKGHRWELLALFFFVLILNVIGAIVFLIGLVITIPITSLALVHAYRTLEQKAGAVAVQN